MNIQGWFPLGLTDLLSYYFIFLCNTLEYIFIYVSVVCLSAL